MNNYIHYMTAFFVTFTIIAATITTIPVGAETHSKIENGVMPEPEQVPVKENEQLPETPIQKLSVLLERASELVFELETQQADSSQTQPNPFADRAINRINNTAIKLYRNLSDNRNENLVFSPLSFYQAFSVVYLGAENETAKQFRNVLDLDLFAPEHDFNSPELQTANAVWLLDKKVELQKSFLKTIDALGNDIFRTMEPVDALAAINDWFNEKTKGRIPKLFDNLDRDTKLIIGNAVYFKGQWEEPFEKAFTKDEPFYSLSGKEQKVPTMHNYLHVPYFKDKDYAFILLPYKNGKYSMNIILPDKGVDFKKFKEQINRIINAMTGKLPAGAPVKKRDVELSLPKFEIESTFNFTTFLPALGITDAFNDKADFSGMTVKMEDALQIGQAIQKANITVDEEGTVAAAATGIAMKVMSAAPEEEPVVFKADRPFIYFIIDNVTGLIVFIGDKIK
ncbi:MAG: serpin family protein [Planctomycetaceae bacterium]|nr:serpin family protein [Planctomycetaceae bacterium]